MIIFEVCLVGTTFCAPIYGYGPGDIMLVLDWYLNDPMIWIR